MLDILEKLKAAMISIPEHFKDSDVLEFRCGCGNIGLKNVGKAKRSLKESGFAYQCKNCLKLKQQKSRSILYNKEKLIEMKVVDTTPRQILSHDMVEFFCRCGVKGYRTLSDAIKTNQKYGFYYQCKSCRKENIKKRSNNIEWLSKIRKAAQAPEHKTRAIQNGKSKIKYSKEQIKDVIKKSGATYEGDLSTPSNTIKVIWPDGVSRRIRIRRFMKDGIVERPRVGLESASHKKYISEINKLGITVESIGHKWAKISYKGHSWEQYWVNTIDSKCLRHIRNINMSIKMQELLDSGLSIAAACNKLGVDHNRFYRNKRMGISPKQTALSTRKFEKLIELPNAVYDKKLVNTQYRPDILVDNLIIEVDGMKWHSEEYKDRNYHFKKWDIFNKLGYKILVFSEYEVKEKRQIVDSMIAHRLGKSTKIQARKCSVVSVNSGDANKFFNKCHLRGKGSGECIGLEYNGKIVAAIRYQIMDNIINISRFACELGISVAGGYSKLLSKLPNGYDIVNFVDRRHGSGAGLMALGFTIEKTHIGFEWTDGYYHFNRRKFLGNSGYEYGMKKFYDYGQIKYIKKA